VLGLFGYGDAERQARSDEICTALQLTNCWQDIAGDLDRDRVYLPQDDLDRFPDSREALIGRRLTPAFADLMRFEVARARAMFARGLGLADLVRGRLRREVRLFAHGGLAILARIEAAGYDVFTCRPTLGRRDLLRLVLKEMLA
jgi:phytoene/squalene synthetase